MVESLSKLVLKYPVPIVACAVGVIVVLSLPIQNLKHDSRSEIWFLEDDVSIVDYRKFQDDFKWRPQLLIAVEFDGSQGVHIKQELLEYINGLKNLDNVSSVIRIDQFEVVDPLISVGVEYPSKDAYADVNRHLLKDAKSLAKKIWPEDKGMAFHYGGVAINAAFYENSEHDRKMLIPMFFVLTLIILWLAFRTLASLLIPLAIILMAMVCSYGLLALLGWKFNALSSILILIVVAASINDSVHLLLEFYTNRRRGLDPKAAAEMSFRKVFVPCLFTTLTTCAGFIGLSFTRLAPVFEFGVVAALSVTFAFLATFFPVCSLLQFCQGCRETRIARLGVETFIRWCTRYQAPLLLFAIALSGIAAWHIPAIKVDSSADDFFAEESETAAALQFFHQRFGNDYRIELLLDKEGELKDEIKMLNTLAEDLATVESISSIDWLRVSSAHALSPEILLAEAKARKWLSDKGDRLRMRLNLSSRSAKDLMRIIPLIEGKLRKYQGRNPVLTGQDLLDAKMNLYIIEGLMTSFSIAFAITSVFIVICFRNLRFSVLAIVLCIWPIIVATPLMPLLNINLNLTTMLIAVITFCVVVDDSIHIISRYLVVRDQGQSKVVALRKTLRHSGKAVWISSLILFCGFGINIFGRHQPTIDFGILASSIVILALLADTALFTSIIVGSTEKKQTIGKE